MNLGRAAAALLLGIAVHLPIYESSAAGSRVNASCWAAYGGDYT
jgi:hypothetical protein